jgi:hypothetical protein
MMNRLGTLQKVEQGQKNPTAAWIMNWGPTLIVGFAYVVFAKRMFRLISRFAVNIFFSDQWKFNEASLFQKHSWWQTFMWQHGWHRQGVGGVFAALIEPLFRWNGRVDAFIVGAIVALTTICALWLKKRLFGQLSIFDALIPALFFTPAQYESLLVTPNFAQGAFPLLLILLYCLAWTRRQNFRYPLILLINFLATFTGFSLFLGLLTPFFLVVDYRATAPEARPARGRFYAVLAVAIATVASFFLGYSFKLLDTVLCSTQPQSGLRFSSAYVTIMFADPLGMHGIGLGTRTAGTILVIVALYLLVCGLSKLLVSKARPLDVASRERALVSAILIMLSITLCVNAAHGRGCFGLSSAQASRYVIYVLPGLLGLCFGLLEIRAGLTRRVLVTAFFMAAVISSFRVSPVLPYFPGIKQRWKTCYLQFEDAKKCDQVVAFPYAHTPDGVNIEEKLQYLKQTRQNLYSETK